MSYEGMRGHWGRVPLPTTCHTRFWAVCSIHSYSSQMKCPAMREGFKELGLVVYPHPFLLSTRKL